MIRNERKNHHFTAVPNDPLRNALESLVDLQNGPPPVKQEMADDG